MRNRPPSVNRLLELTDTPEYPFPRPLLKDCVHRVIDTLRHESPEEDVYLQRVRECIEDAARPSLRTVINATGVVLHTGLGRAVLSKSAVEAVVRVAGSHCILEMDPETGLRGDRQVHVRRLLQILTGAEDSLVVNNNAAAALLAVSALAEGGDVLVSRGELVEIGGSFRIPEVIRAGGARLIEVGSTNRTRISDFETAITDRTRLILRCHPSNFRIVGFTEAPSDTELAALGRRHNIPVVNDAGSGALLRCGSELDYGAVLSESAATGVDVVCASGDKLLGGPQAGILLGTGSALAKCRAHPLARAVRINKLCLAALEATLREYLSETKATADIPTLRAISRTPQELKHLADTLAEAVCAGVPSAAECVQVVPAQSQVGGGALPVQPLETYCVSIAPRNETPQSLSKRLRLAGLAGRIERNSVLLDPRTLLENEIQAAIEIVIRTLETDSAGT
jgi:L-seryl-tRNA(Ser) seleniumtransferase